MDSTDPFRGPPTSHANFCEADYAVSRYIAEFINSLASLFYVIYGIYGLRQLRRKANKSNPGNNDYLRALPYWGLKIVGLCLFSFHLSLKYHTQIMHDLSTLFIIAPLLHRVLTGNVLVGESTRRAWTAKSARRISTIIATVIVSLLLLLVTFNVMADELVVHSWWFLGSVVVIMIQTGPLNASRTILLSNARELSNARWQIYGMLRFGAITMLIPGFYLSLIEYWACGFLTRAREAIGLPWAFLLELRGWCYIFTGIGAYTFAALVDLLVSESDEDLKDLCAQQTFAWPVSWASTSFLAGDPHQRMDVEEKEV